MRPPGLADLGPGIQFAVWQIGFWLGGLLVPGLYDIAPGSRAIFVGLLRPAVPAAVFAVAPAALCVVGAAGLLRGRLVGSAPGLLAGAAFLGVYSLVVAIGPLGAARARVHARAEPPARVSRRLLAGIATAILAGWSWRRSVSRVQPGGTGHEPARPRRACATLGCAARAWRPGPRLGQRRGDHRVPVGVPPLLRRAEARADPPRRALARPAGARGVLPRRRRLPGPRPAAVVRALRAPRHADGLLHRRRSFRATSFNLARARLPRTPASTRSRARGVRSRRGRLAGRWWERDRPAQILVAGPNSLEAGPPGGDQPGRLAVAARPPRAGRPGRGVAPAGDGLARRPARVLEGRDSLASMRPGRAASL